MVRSSRARCRGRRWEYLSDRELIIVLIIILSDVLSFGHSTVGFGC